MTHAQTMETNREKANLVAREKAKLATMAKSKCFEIRKPQDRAATDRPGIKTTGSPESTTVAVLLFGRPCCHCVTSPYPLIARHTFSGVAGTCM
jgi:hypothetical protein